MNIAYSVRIWREGSQYVAHAMPLDVASAGPTRKAARKAVDEAIRVFVASAKAHGTLASVLKGCTPKIKSHCPARRIAP